MPEFYDFEPIYESLGQKTSHIINGLPLKKKINGQMLTFIVKIIIHAYMWFIA